MDQQMQELDQLWQQKVMVTNEIHIFVRVYRNLLYGETTKNWTSLANNKTSFITTFREYFTATEPGNLVHVEGMMNSEK
jgi:hypothetical protein